MWLGRRSRSSYGASGVQPLGQFTTEGWQYCLKLTGPNGHSVGYIYGRPCARRCEARESAVVRASSFLDDDCGYRMWDIHYHEWLQMRSASH
jgi:hypothetical protein